MVRQRVAATCCRMRNKRGASNANECHQRELVSRLEKQCGLCGRAALPASHSLQPHIAGHVSDIHAILSDSND